MIASGQCTIADMVNGIQPITEQKLKTHVEKLLLWNEESQERFLADDPFACRSYTTDSNSVW